MIIFFQFFLSYRKAINEIINNNYWCFVDIYCETRDFVLCLKKNIKFVINILKSNQIRLISHCQCIETYWIETTSGWQLNQVKNVWMKFVWFFRLEKFCVKETQLFLNIFLYFRLMLVMFWWRLEGFCDVNENFDDCLFEIF